MSRLRQVASAAMVAISVGFVAVLGIGVSGHDADSSVHVNRSVTGVDSNDQSAQASLSFLENDHQWT
ncbi:hypothetical protein OG535_19300 [Kitasatospora sp. NBC_00085]|uniref:hypothetical protein n=1 Tax=unclassified Kitasatospora TaxID=2633591 RepID=UPI0032469AE4